MLNRSISRYISTDMVENVDPSTKHNYKTKHPAKIMMLGLVASEGEKCPTILTSANEKIDTEKYLKMLEQRVLSWLQYTYPAGI